MFDTFTPTAEDHEQIAFERMAEQEDINDEVVRAYETRIAASQTEEERAEIDREFWWFFS